MIDSLFARARIFPVLRASIDGFKPADPAMALMMMSAFVFLIKGVRRFGFFEVRTVFCGETLKAFACFFRSFSLAKQARPTTVKRLLCLRMTFSV